MMNQQDEKSISNLSESAAEREKEIDHLTPDQSPLNTQQILEQSHVRVNEPNRNYRQKQKFGAVVQVVVIATIIILLIFYHAYYNIIYEKLSEEEERAVQPLPPSQQVFVDQYLSDELKKKLRDNRVADIHYFVSDGHAKNKRQIVNRPLKKSPNAAIFSRPILKLHKTPVEYEQYMSKVVNPYYRQDHSIGIDWNDEHEDFADLAYYSYQLFRRWDDREMLELQFYRLNNKYQIGQYGTQLPICVVLAGKNNANVIERVYDSVRMQNYSNYRVVHFDDVSDDGTTQIARKYFKKHPGFKSRTWYVRQTYQRGAMFNRYWANINYCQEDDIIVDLDSDDYLIGNQVFQLVNTIYQKGKFVNGTREDVWIMTASDLVVRYPDMPYGDCIGQINTKILQSGEYRVSTKFRSCQLRSYLYKLFKKIDPKDFVDTLSFKQGEMGFYPDFYSQFSMVEMAYKKHSVFIDEYLYYYTFSGDFAHTNYFVYTMQAIKTLPIYKPLKSLDDEPERGDVKIKPDEAKRLQGLYDWVQNWKVEQKDAIMKMYERDKNAYLAAHGEDKP